MANPWFRLYAEFATDAKVQRMSEVNQRRFIMLLCVRCSNADVTLHDDDVTFHLRINETEWLQTKAIFIEKNLIDNDNNLIAWNKRQFLSDSSTGRVTKHREKKKQEGNVSVTPPDTDTDTDTEQIQKQKKTKASPLPAEVAPMFSGIAKQVVSDFCKLRKAKNLPVTLTAMQKAEDEAGKCGLSFAEMVKECTERGWGGFKQSWYEKAKAEEGGRPVAGKQAVAFESEKDRRRRETLEQLNGVKSNESNIIDIN